MKPGTNSTDSECGLHGSERGPVAVIIGVVIPGMVLMALIIIAISQRNKIIGKC